MISVFGQWSGNGLGYFNPTIYESLGYTSSSVQLLLNLVNSIVSAIGALTAMSLTDRMPRRKVLIWGTLGVFSIFVITNFPMSHKASARSES
jgi:predicted MFS family arabinose efflux permease